MQFLINDIFLESLGDKQLCLPKDQGGKYSWNFLIQLQKLRIIWNTFYDIKKT